MNKINTFTPGGNQLQVYFTMLYLHVSHSAHPGWGGGGFPHVTITYDALDLTIQEAQHPRPCF